MIPGLTPNLDPRLRPGGQPQQLNLTPQEQAELIAFLGTLTGQAVYTDLRWSNPLDATEALSLIVLPMDQLCMTPGPAAGQLSLKSPAVLNITYRLESSTDLAIWSLEGNYVGSALSKVSAVVTQGSGRKFYRFAYDPASN